MVKVIPSHVLKIRAAEIICFHCKANGVLYKPVEILFSRCILTEYVICFLVIPGFAGVGHVHVLVLRSWQRITKA